MTRALADAALQEAATLAARLEGRREGCQKRHDVLVRDVSLAKARLAARPAENDILTALQAEAHDKTVGTYERLLTAVCQDVLEQPINIGLNLYTERGLPALDIVERAQDRERDIFEHTGGSLTNVVCMALRAIATTRSGLRQFLAFDEPDCWLEPDKVVAFFQVLANMSERLGVQIMVITHHRISTLGPCVNVVELTGTPATGLQAAQMPDAPGWADEDVIGLRSIRLKNFSSYVDVTVPLSPGLNIVVGANNIGKSRLQRALRSVAYGQTDSSDGDIRDTARPAEVEIRMEHGRTLNFSRAVKRNPVSLWRLTEVGGGIVEVDGVPCENGGRQVPEWVRKTLGIARIDGLDVQLAHQKMPVFLIDLPSTQRAMVLSIGGEADLLREMIAQAKDDRNKDNIVIKDGEKEVAVLKPQLTAFADLDDIKAYLRELDAASASAAKAEKDLSEADQACARLEALQKKILVVRRTLEVTEGLPAEPDLVGMLSDIRDAETAGISVARLSLALTKAQRLVAATEGLPATVPEWPRSDEALSLLKRVEDAGSGLLTASTVLRALEGLVEAVPSYPDVDERQRAAERLDEIATKRTEAEASAASARESEIAAALELSDLLSKLGNLCPLCGTAGIEHHHILNMDAS